MYESQITRDDPGCIVILIDQSYSMSDPFGGDLQQTKSKSELLSDAINNLLYNLATLCTREDGVRNYFDVGVIGYKTSSSGTAQVGPVFSSEILTGRELVALREIADNPIRVENRKKKEEDGAGGIVETSEKFPIWFDPIAEGGTPMCEALRLVQSIIEGWVKSHPESYPPMVFNITDGESGDGDPSEYAETIKDVTTSDGSVLLFNLHLSSQGGLPIIYPNNEDNLPDKYARLLFTMSSVMPPKMVKIAKERDYPVQPDSRGFVFNADIVNTIDLLDIGTKQLELR